MFRKEKVNKEQDPMIDQMPNKMYYIVHFVQLRHIGNRVEPSWSKH